MEDNPANLELVEQLLARRVDLHLLCASDGNLGIELARCYQPKVILLDINLPGLSGIEVMQILRADPSTAHIPIIAFSANKTLVFLLQLSKNRLIYFITTVRLNGPRRAADQALARLAG